MTKNDNQFLDEEEAQIIQAAENGEFVPVKNQKNRFKEIKQMAKNTVKKRPINVRLLDQDIVKLKAEAMKRGIPYQTFISSILHQYLNGNLNKSIS